MTVTATESSATPTWDALIQGIETEHGVVRLARGSDRAQVRTLAALAVEDSRLDGVLRRTGETGALVAALSRRQADRTGRLLQERIARHDVMGLAVAGTIVLVVERGGRILAVAVAGIPVRMMAQLLQEPQQDRASKIALLATFLVKLDAVAVVGDARGQGIGRTLVSTVTELFRDAGYSAMFGQVGQDAEKFYRALGFQVSAPGEPVDVARQIALTQFIGSPHEHECTFITRFRELDFLDIQSRIPWIPLPAPPTASEMDLNWWSVLVPGKSASGVVPALFIAPTPPLFEELGFSRGSWDISRANGGVPYAPLIETRIDADGVHLCRNDPGRPTSDVKLLSLGGLTIEHESWIAMVRERGTCLVVFAPRRGVTPDQWDSTWIGAHTPATVDHPAGVPKRNLMIDIKASAPEVDEFTQVFDVPASTRSPDRGWKRLTDWMRWRGNE